MTFDTRIADSSVSNASWQQDLAATSPPPTAQAAQQTPVGDGEFSDQASGNAPQSALDLQLAQMSNDAYTLTTNGVTGTQSESELEAAGWNRLEPEGDHLVDANGNEVAIDPASLEDSTSGFRAAIYQNDQGQYVVAYAGTDPSEFPDIVADGAQAFGFENTQYNKAVELAKKAEVAFGDGNVIFTGHSLGGGLAATGALSVGATAVTFNTAAPSNDTLRDLGFNPNEVRSELEDSGQIRHYVVDCDPLNLAEKDIPALPIPGIGVVSPPDPVGHELRIALPAGMTPIIDSHGGGGDGTSYVEALRTNTPYSSGGNDNLALETIGNYGDYALNALGSTLESVVGIGKDVYTIGANTVSDVQATLAGDGSVIEKATGVFGDVADGLVDSAGAMAGGAIDGAGDLVQDATDFAGNMIRDVGNAVGLGTPAAAVARVVEGAGNLIDTGANAVGGAVSWVGDKVGDGLEIVSDFAGNAGQFVVDGAVTVGNAIVDGAQVVGNAVVDGAQIVGNAVVDGVQAAGNAIADGANAVGNAVSDGAGWVADKLKFW